MFYVTRNYFATIGFIKQLACFHFALSLTDLVMLVGQQQMESGLQ